MNAMMTIKPYFYNGMWVFDDPTRGLVKEPFVSGADQFMEDMTQNISDAKNGFVLIFSGTPFPGNQFMFYRKESEYGGTWYASDEFNHDGWLCPAMFKYFDEAPEVIYAQVKELT